MRYTAINYKGVAERLITLAGLIGSITDRVDVMYVCYVHAEYAHSDYRSSFAAAAAAANGSRPP